jgi:hypothetical protein
VAYAVTPDIEVGARIHFEYLSMLGASRKGAAGILEARLQRITAFLDLGPGYASNDTHVGVGVRGMVLENGGNRLLRSRDDEGLFVTGSASGRSVRAVSGRIGSRQAGV